MKVVIQVKNVFGKELIYPINETAKILLRLTGKRTFSPADLSTIRDLGYSVEFDTPYLDGLK